MPDGKRILVIDEGGVVGPALYEQLGRMDGYGCVMADTAQRGLDMANVDYFDTIIMDIQNTKISSLKMCETLRGAGIVAPIIVITADDSDGTMISALDGGATDLVVKPFKMGVLLARIRAHIRQFEHSDEAHLNIGDFAFSPSAKLLKTTGDHSGLHPNGCIRLTDKEAQILKFLYLHKDRLVGRDELLGEVWGYNGGITTHTLETHVYRLRQKMEVDPSNAEILVTEPGGYRLIP